MYKGEFIDEIIGDRIILKRHQVTIEEAQQLFSLADESRSCVRIFLPWVDFTHKVEDSFAFIYECNKAWNEKEKAEYGIWHKKNNTLIGGIGVMHFEKNDSAEIGYWLGTPFQGKGYMQEAVRLVENAFFPTLIRLIIRNDVKNIRSANVPAKLGYRLEGVLRSAHKYSDDHYGDINIWSKLRSEWQKQRE